MLSDNDTMKLYMQNIGQYPLVTPEEEIKLAAKIAKGDNDARGKLIRSNLRLVVKIAHDFKGLGLPLLDLISEGNIGLMRAVEKFDPSKGAKLSSYAAWWIKQSMRRALANQARTIRIPVQSASKICKIQAAKVKLSEQLGREPTDKEIADEVKLTERTVTGLRLGKTTTISLHDPIQHGEDGEFRDIIPDEKSSAPAELVKDEETLRDMLRLVETLDEREKTILTLRFGLNGDPPKTLEEVSQSIGRTRERVRQIQNFALEKLRKMLEENGLLESAMDIATADRDD
jgi:RNA polymerase primary sigma factor